MRSTGRGGWAAAALIFVQAIGCGDEGGTGGGGDAGPTDSGGGDARRDMRPADCVTDTDCPAGQMCTPAGVCVPSEMRCTDDSDCDPDGLTGGLFLCTDGTCGPAPLDSCPPSAVVERVCAIASRTSFCVEGLFVSCAEAPSCEACAGACDDADGCAAEDAGPPDMGPADTGPAMDAGPPDMGPADTGPAMDAGPPDMGITSLDGSPPADTGPPADSGPPMDSGPDEDAGPTPDAGPAAVCGNGRVEAGEDCDGPVSPSCTEDGCDTDCHRIVRAAACGDGCTDPGEQCNEPGLTCTVGVCNASLCACESPCGNGVLDPGELCDPPRAADCTSTTYCSPSCQLLPRPSMCGNGCGDPGEDCGEPGLAFCPAGQECSPTNCRCRAICGNGTLDFGENCGEPGAAPCAPTQLCRTDTCQCVYRYRASCNAILLAGESAGDGVYTIDPDGPTGVDPFDVFCDMTAHGGGWTLLGSVVNDPEGMGGVVDVRHWSSLAAWSDATTFGALATRTSADYKSAAWTLVNATDAMFRTSEYSFGWNALLPNQSFGAFVAAGYPSSCNTTWLRSGVDFATGLSAQQQQAFGFTFRPGDVNCGGVGCFPGCNETAIIGFVTSPSWWVFGIGNTPSGQATWSLHDNSTLLLAHMTGGLGPVDCTGVTPPNSTTGGYPCNGNGLWLGARPDSSYYGPGPKSPYTLVFVR